jgi:hypothetical protein
LKDKILLAPETEVTGEHAAALAGLILINSKEVKIEVKSRKTPALFARVFLIISD